MKAQNSIGYLRLAIVSFSVLSVPALAKMKVGDFAEFHLIFNDSRDSIGMHIKNTVTKVDDDEGLYEYAQASRLEGETVPEVTEETLSFEDFEWTQDMARDCEEGVFQNLKIGRKKVKTCKASFGSDRDMTGWWARVPFGMAKFIVDDSRHPFLSIQLIRSGHSTLQHSALSLPSGREVISAHDAQANCLARFTAGWNQLSYAKKKLRLRHLDGKAMKCIFEASAHAPTPGPEFFIDSAHQAENRVQRFQGKNSLSVFKEFEKHFFTLAREGRRELYGYNDTFVGHLIRSPGYFKALWDSEDSPGLSFDYRLDFEKLISSEELKKIKGARWNYVQNGDGNIVYGDLVDVIRGLTEDAVVGQAVKVKNGSRKTKSYFILIKIPE